MWCLSRMFEIECWERTGLKQSPLKSNRAWSWVLFTLSVFLPTYVESHFAFTAKLIVPRSPPTIPTYCILFEMWGLLFVWSTPELHHIKKINVQIIFNKIKYCCHPVPSTIFTLLVVSLLAMLRCISEWYINTNQSLANTESANKSATIRYSCILVYLQPVKIDTHTDIYLESMLSIFIWVDRRRTALINFCIGRSKTLFEYYWWQGDQWDETPSITGQLELVGISEWANHCLLSLLVVTQNLSAVADIVDRLYLLGYLQDSIETELE